MLNSRTLLNHSKNINKEANGLVKNYAKELSDLINKENNSEEEIQDWLNHKLEKDSAFFFLTRLYKQAKQVSQIIAFIWRWIDFDENNNQDIRGLTQQEVDNRKRKRDAAEKLNSYFAHPTAQVQLIGKKLERLFAADPRLDDSELRDSEYKEEAELLREVFAKYKEDKNLMFPIFDEVERGLKIPGIGYILNVDINSYQGHCLDVDKNHPHLYIHSIPYPPRPQLGKATVTRRELEEWIENTEEHQFFADNPYIPTTSS